MTHIHHLSALAATVIGNLDKVEKYGPRQSLPPDVEVEAFLVSRLIDAPELHNWNN